ncbi:leucine-rich repeat protein [Breznakiella homolactica]|uniref:Leucine-rich repeat protein n=1 Tax=Breznakiella homolactica TaxID=2798577 RepID=A0A7T8B979_9SPIR|nr:leucine-rich repeat protein [Breznakiella homolactica]QQO08177.1 leucine-rich repeat protein [Breznakiella homolactica]
MINSIKFHIKIMVYMGILLAFLMGCSSPAGSEPSISVNSIKLPPQAILNAGKTRALAPVLETTGNGTAELVWSSSNSAVATITQDGKVTAVGTGGDTAEITVTVSGTSLSARCVIAIAHDASMFTPGISGDAVTIIGCTVIDPVVVVPEQIDGKVVIAIGANAFENKNTLTEVYLPDAIREIGDYAFFTCTNLTSISLPAATTIGDSAFSTCTNLTSISFPAAATIGDGAFSTCTNLTSISLPSATTIGENAFAVCTNLTSISLPSATTIGESVFFHCTNLTSISLPVATTIGEAAFYVCNSLTSISLPSATTIGDSAFYSCSGLTSISLPSATTIGERTFKECTILARISLPVVTAIGNDTFYGCTELNSIALSANCTFNSSGNSAAWDAFYNYYKNTGGQRAGTYTLNNGSWTGPVL